MKQKINVLIIFIAAIFMLSLSFIYAINNREGNKNYFYDNGYIISNYYEKGSGNVSKIYFDKDAYYKNTSDNEYTFTNSEGKKVNVSEESFVHYKDGSIMSLKKGVAIDLNKIDSKLISYYNIFEGSILSKKEDTYEINNLNEKIYFSKLMYKISNNKYLITAPNIVVSFSEDQTVNMNNYIEIEYVSERVIRIYNDTANYQTISSELFIFIDDIKIDLEYKTISKNNVEYLTMADMVINSNDNIEVLPEKIIVEQDTTDNNDSSDNNEQNQDKPNTNIQDGLDNLLGNLPGEDEKIDEEIEIIQPRFNVESIDVTTLGFENLKISFEDESSVLYGDRIVEILENSTGRVVQRFEDWEEGTQTYVVNSYFSLKPNTEYTISVIGQYKIDDTICDRTFVSKIFRTLDIGLNIKEDYVTTDSLSFAVYRNSYSEVTGFSYNITDSDGNVIVEDTEVEYSDPKTELLIISENKKFKPNTNYFLTIKDIKYGNNVFLTVSYQQLQLVFQTKTLKENPFNSSDVSLNCSVNNRENTITFNVNGINDIYGGIKEYTYNIYDNSLGTLKQSVTKSDSNDLVLNLNQLDLDQTYFNVGVVFEDNEKTIIFDSNNSNTISVSGVSYPTVVRYKESENNDDYETLKGEVWLDDKNNYISNGETSYYRIVLKESFDNSLGGNIQYISDESVVEYRKNNTEFALPVYFEGLNPSTKYMLYVYLIYPEKEIYLGYTEANTAEVDPVYLIFNDDTTRGSDLFDFTIEKNSQKTNVSNNKLRRIVLDLVRCRKDNSNCSIVDGYSTTIPNSQDSLDLNNMIVGNEILNVSSTDFGFDINAYENEYNYKIMATGYSYDYKINIKINDSETNEFDIIFNDMMPPLNLKIRDVLKSEAENLSESNALDIIENSTTVGFNFEIGTQKTPMGEIVKNAYYRIYKGFCEETVVQQDDQFEKIYMDETNKTKFIEVDNDIKNSNSLKRGQNYCVAYYGEYENNQGELMTTDMQKEDFVALKQRSKIDGYIKEYDGNTVTFKLNIVDPDSSVIRDTVNDSIINLVSSDSNLAEQIPCNGENCDTNEYQFKVNNGSSYVLKFVENIGNGNKEQKLYDAFLDTVVFAPSDLQLKVETEVGYIELIVPSDTCLSENQNCVFNEEYINRVTGLVINNQFIKLELNAENNLFAKINLSDIVKKGYGVIDDNGLLNLNDVYIVYDSGKIVDYINSSSNIFIKTIKDKSYYDYITGTFVKEPTMIIKVNDDLLHRIGLNTFKSLDEYSTIGYNLSDNSDNRKTIHFNGAELLPVIVDKNIKIEEVLSTSDINTIYTSTGAEILFETTNGETVGSTLIFELTCDGETEISSVKYSSNGWGSTTGNLIKSITGNNKNINLIFDNIADKKECKYSIKFKQRDNSEESYTYNDVKQQNNQNIIITSLKALYFSNKSTIVQNNGWQWDNEYTDMSFNKNILMSFVINDSKYKLMNDEQILYSIIAKSENGNEVYLTESEKQLETINNYKYSLVNSNQVLSGRYDIILRPQIQNSNTLIPLFDEVLKSDLIITAKQPDFSVTNNGTSVFDIVINDEDGMLSPCSEEVVGVPATNLMQYVDEKNQIYFESSSNKQKKVVYFEMYSLNSEKKEFYKGYSPIAFASETSRLDLQQYFYENNFLSGQYKAKIKYCTVDNPSELKEKTIEKEFNIFNTSSLNIKLMAMPDSYILMLDNPDEFEKDRINKIVYQFELNNGEIVTKTLDNTNDIFNKNDNINFTVSQGSNGTIYFLGLSTGSVLTSNIKSLTINFFECDDKGNCNLLTQWSKS